MLFFDNQPAISHIKFRHRFIQHLVIAVVVGPCITRSRLVDFLTQHDWTSKPSLVDFRTQPDWTSKPSPVNPCVVVVDLFQGTSAILGDSSLPLTTPN